MDERRTLARLRVEEIRQLENSEKGVEREIQQECRREHWRREPDQRAVDVCQAPRRDRAVDSPDALRVMAVAFSMTLNP